MPENNKHLEELTAQSAETPATPSLYDSRANTRNRLTAMLALLALAACHPEKAEKVQCQETQQEPQKVSLISDETRKHWKEHISKVETLEAPTERQGSWIGHKTQEYWGPYLSSFKAETDQRMEALKAELLELEQRTPAPLSAWGKDAKNIAPFIQGLVKEIERANTMKQPLTMESLRSMLPASFNKFLDKLSAANPTIKLTKNSDQTSLEATSEDATFTATIKSRYPNAIAIEITVSEADKTPVTWKIIKNGAHGAGSIQAEAGNFSLKSDRDYPRSFVAVQGEDGLGLYISVSAVGSGSRKYARYQINFIGDSDAFKNGTHDDFNKGYWWRFAKSRYNTLAGLLNR